ncbi:MAG: pilus assembly protein HicB [Paludibacteraceae bacterium]|nr:pilus assembly protein HicB [Paludibacteraceae bacterium]
MRATVIIELSADKEFYAYVKEDLGFGLMGCGDTAEEAKKDLLVAYEEMKDINHEQGIETPVLNFVYKYDMASFFSYYSMLNITEVARNIGINPSQLRRYSRGITKASEKQYSQLREYIHKIANELLNTQL